MTSNGNNPTTTPDPLESWQGPLRGPQRPRATQYFSAQYLRRCQQLSPSEIVRFLDEFKRNYAAAEAARAQSRRSAADTAMGLG